MLSEADVLAAVSSAVASPFAGQLLLGLYSGQTPPHDGSPLLRDLRFAGLRPREAADGQAGAAAAVAAASDLGAQIAAATAFPEAVAAVLRGLVRKLMDVFMIAEDEVSPAKAPTDFGIDSLVAVELRNMFALRAGAEMSIFDIMQSPSLHALAAAVAAKSRFCDPGLVPS
jgi:acyl carrier protein